MIARRPHAPCGLWSTSRILLLCAAFCSSAVAATPGSAWSAAWGQGAERGRGGEAGLRFTHLTTNHGLSQGYVVDILQDRRGFMWFATRDGLNRYDGYTFVVYKHDPNDPGSLSSNFLQDLMEDDEGYLWVATSTGVNRFDPRTERCTRYLHDPGNRDTLGGASVKSVVQDGRGHLWFGTEDSGLDKLDLRRGTFTHYRDDSDGRFVGRITQVIEDSHGDIWFTGERGLFHVDQQSGRVTRHPPGSSALSADSVYEDAPGELWLLSSSPVAALVRYDRRTQRLTSYPLAQHATSALASTTTGGSLNGILAADGEDGLWVPSNDGLSYFDRRARRFTHRLRHDEVDPHSLDSNAVFAVYRDRGGVLWVGTEHSGINVLDFRQQRFPRYVHRPSDPDTLSPGRVKAIHQDPDRVLWVGFFPRALDRVDRKTGRVTHYLPREGDFPLGEGTNVNSIYRDAAGYLWIGGGGSGLVRFDEQTRRFKRYRHDARDPRSLVSNNVYTIYGDRSGQVWVGLEGGISRFDPATDGFVNYPVPDDPVSLANTVWVIYQDRSGVLWAGTWGGVLTRFDERAQSFVSYAPDSRDPGKLYGGGINTILEDRTGTLWVGTFDGLYRHDRGSGAFVRYTEAQGLPSSSVRCIREDRVGRLWLSTQKGVSRFDPREQTFRNYDVSDGLQSDEFSTGCFQAPDGEILFGGSNGLNAFVPENVRDDAYVPPVVITDFTILNRPVRVGSGSVLERAIPYVESLTLSHEHNVFSFEFAALSFANAHKNRYRYRLEGFDTAWNEADSRHRLATYTNLDPGHYVFRVQGSNSDGLWNEQGVSLPIVLAPPWWGTTWFRALAAAALAALLWVGYRARVRVVERHAAEMSAFNERLMEAQEQERTRIAGELHDSVMQQISALSLVLGTAKRKLPDGSEARDMVVDVQRKLIDVGSEVRQLSHDMYPPTLKQAGLPEVLRGYCDAFSHSRGTPVTCEVDDSIAELSPGTALALYRIAQEALGNAAKHAAPTRVDVRLFRSGGDVVLSVADDGRGFEPGRADAGLGLVNMRERARQLGGTFELDSRAGRGTTVKVAVPFRAREARLQGPTEARR